MPQLIFFALVIVIAWYGYRQFVKEADGAAIVGGAHGGGPLRSRQQRSGGRDPRPFGEIAMDDLDLGR